MKNEDFIKWIIFFMVLSSISFLTHMAKKSIEENALEQAIEEINNF